jgi:hypothetical protein
MGKSLVKKHGLMPHPVSIVHQGSHSNSGLEDGDAGMVQENGDCTFSILPFIEP